MTYDPTTDTRPRCPITGPGVYEQADGGEARVETRHKHGPLPWKGVDADGCRTSWSDDGQWWTDGSRSRHDLIRYLRPLDTEQPDALKALSGVDLDAAEASAVEAARAPFKAERERREQAWKAFIPEAQQFVAAEWEASGYTDRRYTILTIRAIAKALASKATAQ